MSANAAKPLLAPSAKAKSETEPKHNQTDELIEMAVSDADLFATPADEIAYAAIRKTTHREVWPVHSRGFKRWLTHRYFVNSGKAPSGEALNRALATLDPIAAHGAHAPVYLRRAEKDGKLYLDLCDDRWRAIEVSAEGWRIVETPPVYFTRSPGMMALCEPARGGGIEELRTLLTVATNCDFHLIVAWLLAALRASGPYPILALTGEGGTAKTSTARLLRGLIDPHLAKVRRPPQNERDLFVGASKTSVLVYDNLSNIPDWLSDALCVVATGGAYTARQLHTDGDEVIFSICLPVMITSVGEVIARSDLASRAITVTLGAIPDQERKSEAELDRLIEAAQPRILGALLDAASHGLRGSPHIAVERLPRLARFMQWAQACEGAFCREGSIQAAFEKNSADATDGVLEADSVALALMGFLAANGGAWRGKGEQLLSHLAAWAPQDATREKSWPRDPTRLSSRLTLAAPSLRQKGIMITRRKSNGERLLDIASGAI
jgi:hypothetical protein